MKKLLFSFCVLLGCLGVIAVPPARSHHTVAHGGAAGTLFNPYSAQSRPPRNMLSFGFQAEYLDEALGEVFRYQLSGEYAVHPRFSLGARIPFLSVRERFLPQTDSIGDVALTLKGLLWNSAPNGMSLSLGADFSFPTGNEQNGTGGGQVVASPFVNYAVRTRPLDFYVTLGTTLALENRVNPALDFNVGINVPLLRDKLPLQLFVAVQGSTSLSSQVFQNGSTKAYLSPGIILYLRENLAATLGAKVSIIDTLRVKPSVLLPRESPLLLNDVRSGFEFHLDYFF